jgi:hypothetical protein
MRGYTGLFQSESPPLLKLGGGGSSSMIVCNFASSSTGISDKNRSCARQCVSMDSPRATRAKPATMMEGNKSTPTKQRRQKQIGQIPFCLRRKVTEMVAMNRRCFRGSYMHSEPPSQRLTAQSTSKCRLFSLTLTRTILHLWLRSHCIGLLFHTLFIWCRHLLAMSRRSAQQFDPALRAPRRRSRHIRYRSAEYSITNVF